MIRNPMPVIPEEEYRMRWQAVRDLMERRDLDLILAYADDRATPMIVRPSARPTRAGWRISPFISNPCAS